MKKIHTNSFYFLIILMFLQYAPKLNAQDRLVQTINTNWEFYKGDTIGNKNSTWENISLPHTWNTKDVLDDVPGYYRGKGWYKKTIYVPASYKSKEVYLFFEGVGQVATVYVNGKFVGKHIGSYTAFNFKINDFIQWNENAANEIAIQADNSHNEDIPPLSADFTFYGGIYRDVYLIATNAVHFDADNLASKGIFITTPVVTNDKATVDIKGRVVNSSSATKSFIITNTIIDEAGNVITRQQKRLVLSANQRADFEQKMDDISKPNLWSPESPYLYKVVSTVTDAASKEQLDEVSNPLGLRWFRFTADKGFFLNGKPYKIWGASRHQDYKNLGNALPDALHVKDIQLLKEMGANFIRIAHYPQDPAVLEACDRIGILASEEIPVVNAITESEAFYENCKHMQLEMIRQNYNHPSVIIWAYMNEVLLRMRFSKDKPRQEIYLSNVRKLAGSIDSLTRAEDPYRYTMIPFHGDLDLYIKAGLVKIPQVVGWNQYSGWYSSDISRFGANMDKHRLLLPDKPVLVTEYGADGDPRLHSFSAERFDKTLEYETFFHQGYVKAIKERPFVSGGILWNLADFIAEGRAESMPHFNNKGLLTIDREPKDAYLFYQSQLLKEPFIKIGSRSWQTRGGIADAKDKLYCTQPVQIFCNESTISLSQNGVSLGTASTTEGIAVFSVPFTNGINQLEAITTVNGKMYKDIIEIKFLLQPKDLSSELIPFKEINISLGDKRFFADEQLEQVWLPEKPYEQGGWGFIGGRAFTMKDSKRQPYGSDKNILGTDYDPIYETQRVGIDQFKLDVPEGKYEVTFHFAELISIALKDANIYNLENSQAAVQQSIDERSFDVFINNQKVIEALGNKNYLIPETAYSTKVVVDVTDKKGIIINFKALKGETILNGLQVRKIY